MIMSQHSRQSDWNAVEFPFRLIELRTFACFPVSQTYKYELTLIVGASLWLAGVTTTYCCYGYKSSVSEIHRISIGMVARSTIKLDESQTLNLRKLSYVGGLTSKGQVGVLFWEHRVWILRIASLYKVRPEVFAAFIFLIMGFRNYMDLLFG